MSTAHHPPAVAWRRQHAIELPTATYAHAATSDEACLASTGTSFEVQNKSSKKKTAFLFTSSK